MFNTMFQLLGWLLVGLYTLQTILLMLPPSVQSVPTPETRAAAQVVALATLVFVLWALGVVR